MLILGITCIYGGVLIDDPIGMSIVDKPVFLVIAIMVMLVYFLYSKKKPISRTNFVGQYENKTTQIVQRDVLGQIRQVENSSYDSLPFTNFSPKKFYLRSLLIFLIFIYFMILNHL